MRQDSCGHSGRYPVVGRPGVAILHELHSVPPREKRFHAKTGVVLVPNLVDINHAGNVGTIVLVRSANAR
jgi:hypothetical protein